MKDVFLHKHTLHMIIFSVFILVFVGMVLLMINEARKTVAEINKLNESLIFYATLNEKKFKQYHMSPQAPQVPESPQY